MDLKNNFTFQIFFLSCTFAGCLFLCIIIFFLRKRGINLYKKNRLLKIFFIVSPILFLPVFLHPGLSLGVKIEILLFGCLVATANFFAVDRGGKRFRKWIGYETKWDKEEKEFLEKEKNEKLKRKNDTSV